MVGLCWVWQKILLAARHAGGLKPAAGGTKPAEAG
jgi:hypothetical protein